MFRITDSQSLLANQITTEVSCGPACRETVSPRTYRMQLELKGNPERCIVLLAALR